VKPPRRDTREGAALLSGTEEQTARAIWCLCAVRLLAFFEIGEISNSTSQRANPSATAVAEARRYSPRRRQGSSFARGVVVAADDAHATQRRGLSQRNPRRFSKRGKPLQRARSPDSLARCSRCLRISRPKQLLQCRRRSKTTQVRPPFSSPNSKQREEISRAASGRKLTGIG
jgi:hypothetical protein